MVPCKNHTYCTKYKLLTHFRLEYISVVTFQTNFLQCLQHQLYFKLCCYREYRQESIVSHCCTVSSYLICMGMTAYHYRLSPAGHQTRNVLTDDGLTEHSAPKDIPDCAIGRLPHLLQIKLYTIEKRQHLKITKHVYKAQKEFLVT